MPTTIPPEIMHQILSMNYPWDLPTLSLVCRLWQALAFPTLYHTVFLDIYDHATLLVDRINSETDNTPLRISDYARNLFVGFECPYDYGSASISFTHIDLSRFKQAISKLHKLERLAWTTDPFVLRLGSFISTQTMIKLESINLRIDFDKLSP
ncbi:hypothetical protein FS749_009055, partial [Ceratobasidium sp. UAMH 11750]